MEIGDRAFGSGKKKDEKDGERGLLQPRRAKEFFHDEVGSRRSQTGPDRLRIGTIGQLLDAVVIGTALAGERATELETSVHSHHLRQDLQDLLGHGLVVYGDQVLGLGVDLKSLVESEGGLDLVGAYNCGN